MSGFFGILNFNGAPLDGSLLSRITERLEYRGPDARCTWTDGNVGFGHAMLRTTFESACERQPCTLDGQSWITADCRVDAREDLLRELSPHGRSVSRDTPDPELILNAYAVWGTECLAHLIGDFAFAIWDGPNQRLFCARDHFGVRPFFWTKTKNALVFGNTLNSLRLHPEVSDRKDDLAIADFLLFGLNQNPSATSFEDIRRLPPAHALIFERGNLRTYRYWTLAIDEPLRFRRWEDYVDRFDELLGKAVGDRLRTEHVAIFLSGGLDSTSIAAMAAKLAAASGKTSLSAYTTIFENLIPDREREYAQLAADHLKVPVIFEAADGNRFYESCDAGGEPLSDPALIHVLGSRDLGLKSFPVGLRVALYGEGPDNALHYEWKPYLRHELRHLRLLSLLREALAWPFLLGAPPLWKRLSGAPARNPQALENEPFPHWLNPGFVDRLNLKRREAFTAGGPVHPIRPIGYASFSHPLWQHLTEGFDSGVTESAAEIRYPFLDVRIIRYLLSLPVVPWCRDKFILRRAGRGHLPAAILNRKKTPLAEDPQFAKARQTGFPLLPDCLPLAEYVDRTRLNGSSKSSSETLNSDLRPISLAFFLRSNVIKSTMN